MLKSILSLLFASLISFGLIFRSQTWGEELIISQQNTLKIRKQKNLQHQIMDSSLFTGKMLILMVTLVWLSVALLLIGRYDTSKYYNGFSCLPY
jgi:hypothetical protein